MMTIKDYAQDVDKTVEEIEALCDKIGIDYQDENTDLDETSIILLDNAVAEKDNEEEIIEDEEVEETPKEESKEKAEEDETEEPKEDEKPRTRRTRRSTRA